jgi:hypothetical protein
MNSFEDWLNEIEGFSLRSERAYDDLVKNPKDPVDNWNDIKTWLQAAYIAGWDGSKAHIREMLK